MLSLRSFLALCLLTVPVFAFQEDPEATKEGRSEYLGRAIARTMHWTGADWLLRETREDEENGERLREWLEVAPGEVICDFGCGNGYHTLPLAKAVGEEGKVFAVDLQLPMLAMLRERLGDAGLENVELVEATLDDPKLPPGSCDRVLMVDVYHELTHPVRVLEHVRKALKPGGELVLVEFRSEDPKVPIKRKHKMSQAQMVREMGAGGFRCTRSYDGLPWQHVMTFTPVDEPRLHSDEFGRGFLRSLRGGQVRELVAYLAEEVDAGGRLFAREDWVETLTEEVSDAGEHWAIEQALWSWSIAEGALLGRKGTKRQRIEWSADKDGAFHVDRWWRHSMPHVGPLVAMNTGTGRGTPQEQVELIAELGYGGIGWGIWRTAEVRAHCEALGMDLWSVYVVLDVAKAPDPREEQLAKAIAAMKGGPGQVWLALESSAHEHRSPKGDDAAKETLKRVLAMAEEHGVEVALYPHTNSWLETCEDALRVMAQVEDPRLGLCFNLCHYLKNHEDSDPSDVLHAAGKRLLSVTINGADTDGTDWSTLIQPLGAGSYDVKSLLQVLESLNFDGPIGLQGFGLKGEPKDNLSRSMAAWKALR